VTLEQFLQDMLWSGIAALGFAVLFNVPRRLLPGCFLSGAAGHSIRAVIVSLGVSIEFGTLIGAVTVGFLSVFLSRHYRVPASCFTVTGAIPLVPGTFAYQTIIGLLNATSAAETESIQLLARASISGIRTALILSALAFGIAAPSLLFRRPHIHPFVTRSR
jgi:uncharacterized membrane protein YjjB (DUF3815 family)